MMDIGESLELVGHYNPHHEYPQHVVPIMRNTQGALVAAYWSGEHIVFQLCDGHSDVIFILAPLSDEFVHFDPKRSRLFAYSEQSLVVYDREGAEWFYRKLLLDKDLIGANPFFKLSLAKAAGLVEEMLPFVRSCVLELGGRSDDGFASEWYRSQRDQSPADLPSNIGRLLGDVQIVNVACLRGDEPLLFTLSRVANEFPDGRLVISPEVREWLPASPGEDWFGIDAFLREVDSTEIRGNTVAVATCELVLAVRGDYLSRHELESSWESVLNNAIQGNSFSWIRPRGETVSGGLVEWALIDMFGPSQTGGLENPKLRTLADCVVRHSEFDEGAAEFGIEWDTWNVDAMVVKRHAVSQLFGHLSGSNRPVLIPYRVPLFVDYGLTIRPHILQARKQIFELCQVAAMECRLQGVRAHSFSGVAAASRLSKAQIRHATKTVVERAIAVCLVVDVSASMAGEKLEAAKQGVATMLGFLSADRTDAVGLVQFSSGAINTVPIGRIHEVGEIMEAQIRSLHANGRTALLDAIALGCDEVAKCPGCLQAVIVLTDGHENNSRHSLTELTSRIQGMRNPPTILGLAYGDDADYGLLQRLAEMTKGTVLRGSVLNIAQLYEHFVSLL